jgi:hypothetical protein
MEKSCIKLEIPASLEKVGVITLTDETLPPERLNKLSPAWIMEEGRKGKISTSKR